MRRVRRGIAMAAVALGCAACATPAKVQTVAAVPPSEITARRTFAFVRAAVPQPRADAFSRTRAGEEARRRVARALEQRGYEPARDGERPELLVAIDAVGSEHPIVENWGERAPYAGWVYRWGGAGESARYVEETIVVELLDASTGRVLWSGRASDVVDGVAHDDVRAVGEAVDAVMLRAPSRIAGARRPPL